MQAKTITRSLGWRTVTLWTLALFLLAAILGGMMENLLHPSWIRWQWWCAGCMLLFGWIQIRHRGLRQQHVPPFVLSVLVLPVLLAVVAPPVPLGADVLDRQDYALLRPQQRGQLQGREMPWLQGNHITLGEEHYFDALMTMHFNAEHFDGSSVEMTGFTATGRGVPAGHSLIARLLVTCHVAHAQPEGLLTADDSLVNLPDDTWVAVSGTLEYRQLEGRGELVLGHPQYTILEDPPSPYVFLQ